MRRLIEDPVYMTYDEMKDRFDGKWIMIVKCNYTPYNQLLGGIPVVEADKIYEGQDDGFYDQFWTQEYAVRAYKDFRDHEPAIVSVFEI